LICSLRGGFMEPWISGVNGANPASGLSYRLTR
jgi:hypothetical protein